MSLLLYIVGSMPRPVSTLGVCPGCTPDTMALLTAFVVLSPSSTCKGLNHLSHSSVWPQTVKPQIALWSSQGSDVTNATQRHGVGSSTAPRAPKGRPFLLDHLWRIFGHLGRKLHQAVSQIQGAVPFQTAGKSKSPYEAHGEWMLAPYFSATTTSIKSAEKIVGLLGPTHWAFYFKWHSLVQT